MVGEKPAVSAAAEQAIVLQKGLTVYSGPVESRPPVAHLIQGEKVLTRAEIFDSEGQRWCDVLNREDKAMLGFVRCEGLKDLEPKQPKNWRIVPSPEDIVSRATKPKKTFAAPKTNNPSSGVTRQSVQDMRVDRVPQ